MARQKMSPETLMQLLRDTLRKMEDEKSPAARQDWTKIQKKCPKCGETGPVDPDFGVKIRRGLVHAQSWCRKCRATTSYYGKPLKYKTRTRATR